MSPANSYKNQILNLSHSAFSQMAMEIFRWQAAKNPVYSQYLQSLSIDPVTISHPEQIPFLPISFFKTHSVLSGTPLVQTKFLSSGTTGMQRSTHYIADPDWYLRVSEKVFQQFYSDLDNTIILALLPSYQENPHSSLIYMINYFIRKSHSPLSGFIKSTDGLLETLRQAAQTSRKVFLFGVAYALLDLAETGLSLPDITLIETGGMKGRRKELTKEELHQTLLENFQLSKIHSEYGMTELLSQAYSSNNGFFLTPPWMKIMTREINDPFCDNTGIRSGVIKVADLANIDSCCFIETEDIGICTPEGFRVLGRLDNSEIRGCNLLYEG